MTGVRLPVVVRSVGWTAVVAAGVAIGGLAVLSPVAVIGLLGVLALAVLATRPTWAAVLAVAVLPFQSLVLPALPVEVGATDVLVLVALGGWAVRDAVAPRAEPRLPYLRPVAIGLGAYAVAAAVSVVVHPTTSALVTGGQRALLVVGGLAVGAGLVRERRLRAALLAYVASSTVLGLAAIATTGAGSVLGVQKNPAGGFLAVALVVAVVLRPVRWWYLAAAVLAAGLVGTQSRGALIGVAVAAVVVVVLAQRQDRLRLGGAFGVAGVLFYAMYLTLPESAQARLRTVSGSSEYAITSREQFRADALDTFHSAPWWGIGVGNYEGGSRLPLGPGTDPHQVLYFQLAEGGVVLLAGFLLLAATSLLVGVLAVRTTRVAVAAVAVQAATLVHALGDVYWVRGTPVPAYLLLGAALATVAYARRGDPRGADQLGVPRPAPDLVRA